MSRKKNKKKKQTSLIDPEKTIVGCREKCWESNLSISVDEKCPHVTERETPKIIIPYEIWHQIMALTKELSTEWLGYLGGSHLQSGDWKVTDIRVPKQEVTSITVKPIDTPQAEGVVHSHVNMGCFFSGVDDDYLNENHDFSIVVNKSECNKAVTRINLPCGSLSVVEADVAIEYPGCPDVSEFIEEAKKNIEEEKITVPRVYSSDKKWNYKKGAWETKEEAKKNETAIDDEIPQLINASADDLGVPDYNPKQRNKHYKGWDYYDNFDLEDRICT